MPPEIDSTFKSLPPQWRFLQSKAKIRGYGGAMGGGKSRCLCELALDLALDYPGITIPIARQEHTAIIETTKRTMLEQVLPRELIEHQKESGGEDYVRLGNGSTIHFIGLNDPGKWFSSEIGFAMFDEAHQISEQAIVTMNTRLRQRCQECVAENLADCSHYPHGIVLAFNPENPGHWLYKWFIEGATVQVWPDNTPDFIHPGTGERIVYAGKRAGYIKEELFPSEATRPIGDAEFVIAKAMENVYLPTNYIDEQLGGLPKKLRERYLEGQWLYVSGSMFFDQDALGEYEQRLVLPRWVCRTSGDTTGLNRKAPVKFEPVRKGETGSWWLWAPPVRARKIEDDAGNERELPAHRYVLTVDVSSGTSNDYSAIQVLDVETYGQVAEFQGKLDMDELALEAFRAAVVYNGALVAVEITGGWGFSVNQRLEPLIHKYRGPREHKPSLFTRRVEDRLKKIWTDKLGWDTTTRTRAAMLDTLEQAIRERELGIVSHRCHSELVSFVWPAPKDQSGPFKGVPQAQPGANDDLVISLAMAVQVASQLPKELRRVKPKHRPQPVLATGYQ